MDLLAGSSGLIFESQRYGGIGEVVDVEMGGPTPMSAERRRGGGCVNISCSARRQNVQMRSVEFE